MGKPKVKLPDPRKCRLKNQTDGEDEDISLEVNCCTPAGNNKHVIMTIVQEQSFPLNSFDFIYSFKSFSVKNNIKSNCNYPGLDCQQPEVTVTPENCVKLQCTRHACPLSGLLHQDCFHRLEAAGLSALANNKGRARSWSSTEREKVGVRFYQEMLQCFIEN